MTHFYYCKTHDRVLVTRGAAPHFNKAHGMSMDEAEDQGISIDLGSARGNKKWRDPGEMWTVVQKLKEVAGRGLRPEERK